MQTLEYQTGAQGPGPSVLGPEGPQGAEGEPPIDKNEKKIQSPPALNRAQRRHMNVTGMSKHSRRVKYKGETLQFSFTKKFPLDIKLQNRKRNKRMRAARKINR